VRKSRKFFPEERIDVEIRDPDLPARRDAAIERAVSLFDAGEFDAAEALTRKLREAYPSDDTFPRLLAQIAFRQARFEEAIVSMENALGLNPMNSAYHNDFGAILAACERWPEAEAAYRMAKALDPKNANAAFNLALALSRQDKADAALEELDTLETQRPDFSETCALRGKLLLNEKRFDEAVDALSKAIALGDDAPDVQDDLGSALFQAGRNEEAFEVFFKSGKVDAENAQMNCAMGHLMLKKGELEEARRFVETAIEIDPALAEPHNGLGVISEKEDDIQGAEAEYSRALEIEPENTLAYICLGNCHKEQARWDAARACYERALEIDPEMLVAWNNLAVLLYDERRFDAADEAFQKALSPAADSAPAGLDHGALPRLNRGIMRLALGDFEVGWKEYEERHALRVIESKGDSPYAKFVCPRWEGEDLDGKSLLIHTEQGYGDNIQFIRYLDILRARCPGARLFCSCHRQTFRLFSGIASRNDVTLLSSYDSRDPTWDFYVLMLSLPMYLGGSKMTIPNDTPYLELPEAFVSKWRARVSGLSGKRVGIVWSGSEHYKMSARRNMKLSQFAPFFEIPGIAWVSLQKLPKGDAAKEIEAEGLSEKIFDPMPDVKDFADTAAIIRALDLVIAVDTAVLHLAGAMGKPVWLLNRFDSDWRWQFDSSDSLWYPTLRIFRQRTFGDWGPVVREAADALRKWVDASVDERMWTLLDPPRPDAAFNLALTLSRDGDAKEALRVLETLEKKHPDFAWQFALRGKILRSEGRFAEAVDALSRAVALGIETPGVVAELGIALAEAGFSDDAFKALAESGKADTDDPRVDLCLGKLMRERGKTEEARRFFEKAVEANPQFAEALDALASLLRDTGDIEAAEATRARRKALDESFERYKEAFDGYAAALFGVGKA
jgi:tetratricopeptide (TPR) repeat protein